jgi:predicted phage baseplate assembly protein
MTEPSDNCANDASQPISSTGNRPGLSHLAYRIGTYSTFLEQMTNQLARYDLSDLKVRDAGDPAIALLDAWAMVADVLTFYQERIANEGFLRTATERRSLLELAALVGASLRPGVSASVSIAYTLDQNSVSTVPVGSRVQSLPQQDQLPQSFEVSGDLQAQASWNNLAPLLTRPQILSTAAGTIYVKGLSTNLKPNDPLLVIAGSSAVRTIATVDPEMPHDRTRIGLFDPPAAETRTLAQAHNASVAELPSSRITSIVRLLHPLAKPSAASRPRSPEIERSVPDVFAPGSGIVPATVRLLKPEARAQFFEAVRNATVTPDPTGEVHAFRVKAAPFGHNAPLKSVTDERGVVIGTEEWPLSGMISIDVVLSTKLRRERDVGSVGEMEALFSDARKSVFVQVSMGSEKASQTVELPSTESSFAVGRWQFDISFDHRTFRLKSDTAAWTCEIRHREENEPLTVKINEASDLKIPVGQSTESAMNGEWLRISTVHGVALRWEAALAADPLDVIDLDSSYDQITPDSWVAINYAGSRASVVRRVEDVQKVSVARYGLTGRVTRLRLNETWLRTTDLMLSALRSVTVLAQSERLEPAEAPIENEDICGDSIELADFYGDLPVGRKLIVEGERNDIEGTSGIRGAELVTLAGVDMLPPDGDPAAYPGAHVHSRLQLATSLSYRYKRETVVVHGNVAEATHGETKHEVLGSGDGSKAMQRFTLKQGPVTYTKANTAGGTKSTLEVRVNGIPWKEAASHTDAGPFDRCFVTQTDDADKTTVIFGDGINGMRLPTGRENITATYRVNLGSIGNVPAGAISQLATRPFGVKAVASPLEASGGADRDAVGRGRSNIPRAVAGIDRLVSVDDYADFASMFGGVGQAMAIEVPGRRSQVYLTVAGATWADNPFKRSDNLQRALAQAGDSNIFFEISPCELMLLIIAARVVVTSQRSWVDVEPDIRAALTGRFAYELRELGQSIALSEVIAVIQNVPGVAAVSVTTFDSIAGSDTDLDSRLKQKLASLGTSLPASSIEVQPVRIHPVTLAPLPAQLAFMSGNLPDTLMLSELVP